jgi:hypothetical protein
MTGVVVLPGSARICGIKIRITEEMPFMVLCRVVSDYGVILLCRTGLLVLPVDKEAADWISATLSMLGFASTTEES